MFLLIMVIQKYKRKEYGFSQEDFFIVTVGIRLRYEIDIEMVQNMIGFLERNKRLDGF